METPDREDVKCVTCGKTFDVKKSKAARTRFCSMACRRSDPDVKNMKDALATTTKNPLTPGQSAQIRGQIAEYVRNQIEVANEVVMNGKSWTPTQARVFGMLLNKVVPDLNASFVQHEHQIKDLTEMSRDELEAIASGLRTIEGEIAEHEDP